MKISDQQINEFIALYKEEYRTELTKVDALEQIQALVTLVKYMVPIKEAKSKSRKDVSYK